MQEPDSKLIPERIFDNTGELCGSRSSDMVTPVAAIGVAAGGREAVSQLLNKLSPSLGMVYIIVQSGPPGQEEILPDHLNRYTKMKVQYVEEELFLERDQVYILPPDTYMCIEGRKLVHFPRARTEGGYHTVDFFLTALAAACQEKVVGILLSGITADGAAGFRAIRAEGGITIAQDDTARFKGMPHNAISSGYTDLVLCPEQIAKELAVLNKYIPRGPGADDLYSNNKREITEIYLFLLERFKLDFSLYSPVTVSRRILRRMRINRIQEMGSYMRLLQEDEREADLLRRDLLLYITGFFRQPEIYQALTRNILPAILKNRKPGDTLRLWIPSCYTGEEAWSIAIVLHEYWREKRIGIPIQLFATDMSAAAIHKARTGLYKKIILQNVSNRRLNEYFTRTEGGYRVAKPIRDLCVFAVQDPLSDPSFANMDIICCENRMISLEPGPRETATRAFHYSLKPSGCLLLGRFERIDLPADLFTPSTDNGCSFFKKEFQGPRRDFLLNEPFHRTTAGKIDPVRTSGDKDAGKEADMLLLSRYVPPGILVDKDLRILRFYGNTAPYCRPSPGKAALSLFKIVRDELSFELENLLERVQRNHQAAIKGGILLPDPAPGAGNAREITLEVIPVLSAREEDRLLLLFRETNPEVPDRKFEKDGHSLEMENDLRAARQQILTISEAFERKQDELRFAYEESMSWNEELQSRNEQLEASGEEWRSTGEGLLKINGELHARSDEWKESALYARAIVDNIGEPILVLNGNGRVHSANRALYDIFRLRPGQVEGRYLHEIEHGLFKIDELEFRLQSIMQKKEADADLEWKGSFYGLGEKIIIFRLRRMMGEAGPSSYILLTLEDITRRRMAERRKDEFIGIASHELKTPVTSIQAYSQILYSELLEANDQRSAQLVNKLVNQVSRLTRMTKDLLDLTSISEGQLRLKEDYFDLNRLTDEIIEEMQRTTEHRIIKAGMQPLPEIWADRERISQVLTNLIANAIKYSPAADRVEVSAAAGTDRVCFSVRDFGIGIPEEIRNKIFDRFFRADFFAQAHSPGLGLGLYISYEIVRQHGGTITVSSEEGKGSVFTMELPLRAPK